MPIRARTHTLFVRLNNWTIWVLFCKCKRMLQAADADRFNTLVPKAHNSECQNLLFHYKLSQ